MPNHSARTLERQAEHLYCIIAAAEPWSTAYSDDTDTHAAIIKHEARLERALRAYFRGLITRIPNYVNWDTYRSKALQAYDINVIVNDDNFMAEDGIFLNVITDLTVAGLVIGAQAGENIYKTPLGIDSYQKTVQDRARKQSSKLVTQINSTTRDYLQQSLETSIRLGETTDEAQARIADRLGDYKRAGTIARTESVNSYQGGMLLFGQQSNAVSKEWQAIAGGCYICAPLDGERAAIDDNFSEGDDAPPAHPNCRCGMRLIYQDEANGQTSEGDLVDSGE